MGWAGKKNGELIFLAQARFDFFLTTDQNLSFQQNLDQKDITVIVACAKSNAVVDLLPLMPQIRLALATIGPPCVIRIGESAGGS